MADIHQKKARARIDDAGGNILIIVVLATIASFIIHYAVTDRVVGKIVSKDCELRDGEKVCTYRVLAENRYCGFSSYWTSNYDVGTEIYVSQQRTIKHGCYIYGDDPAHLRDILVMVIVGIWVLAIYLSIPYICIIVFERRKLNLLGQYSFRNAEND